MEEYASFRKFITPSIIRIIFWIGVAVAVISGLAQVISGFSAYIGGGALKLSGFLTIVLGPLAVRIWCELIMLGFRIYDALLEIRDAQTGSSGEGAPSPPPTFS